MTDNYEFAKSCLPQGVDFETPYARKDFQFIQDINSGIYSNNGQTLVSFDLSAIYNSSVMTDTSAMFLTIPVTLVSAYVADNTAGTLVAPTAATSPWATAGLKCGYHQLVHGCDLNVDGKSIEQFTPYLNTYVSVKMLSMMSQDDLKSVGASLGFGEVLDNVQSQRYNFSSGMTVGTITAFPGSSPFALGGGLAGGNGMVNNSPFPVSTLGSGGDQNAQGVQFIGTYNNGYYSRLKRYSDATNGLGTTGQNFYGASASTGSLASSFMTATQLNTEFKPYSVVSGNYMITYDVAVIRLSDILDSMKSLGLMKRFSGQLRLYLNTGVVGSGVTTGGKMVSSSTSNSFTGTCPLIQSSLQALPTNTTGVVTGLFIAKATTTNTFGVNLASSGAIHPMSACRLYYPQVTLKPERLREFLSENQAKKVVYTSVLYNTFNNITSGSNFSALVQSGVTNIRGVWIIPLVSSVMNGTTNTAVVSSGITTFSQLQSPFDVAPSLGGGAPISLVGLQVAVGGVNQLADLLNYQYQNFLEQVTLYEKLNALDFGLSCGLINETIWSNNRSYYVDCTRGNRGDEGVPKNLTLTFTNNSNVTIDCLVFTEYFTEMSVNVETSAITK